jgi:hypothetical protein
MNSANFTPILDSTPVFADSNQGQFFFDQTNCALTQAQADIFNNPQNPQAAYYSPPLLDQQATFSNWVPVPCISSNVPNGFNTDVDSPIPSFQDSPSFQNSPYLMSDSVFSSPSLGFDDAGFFGADQAPAMFNPMLPFMAQPGHMSPSAFPNNKPAKPYSCMMCFRSFTRKHDLQRHIRVHTGDKPYKCKFCDRSFARTDALKRHLRVDDRCKLAFQEYQEKHGPQISQRGKKSAARLAAEAAANNAAKNYQLQQQQQQQATASTSV